MNTDQPFIHPEAVVETENIGARTRIWRNAHVLPGARIGSDCNVGEGCFIEGNVTIGNGVTIKNNIAVWDNITVADDVFLGPNVVFTNDLRPRAFVKKTAADLIATTIMRGASIGANATIVCGITIGEYALIGAGAVVTRDVAPYHLVLGNPARFHQLVCRCGEPIPAGLLQYTCPCGFRCTIENLTVSETR